MDDPTRTILVVDPDDDWLRTREALRSRTGHRVVSATSIGDAIDRLDASVACVLTAHDLPDGTGVDLVRRVRETVPDAAGVLYTDVDPDEIDGDGETVVEYVPEGSEGAREELVDLVEHATSARTGTAYPLPDDEDARLAAIDRYREDDEGLGEALDRLASLATGLFDVSMVSIGIVDEQEQRFLAGRGVDLDPIDREETVCTYAILEEGVTVVEDLQADPRFAENDAVRERGLRSYASANLTTPEGHAIGTVCLYDDEVRTYDGSEREHLELLAAEAADQLELRRCLREADDRGGGDDE